MNNTCPSCGALYNVATKDVGRRLKCKKCGTPLAVDEAGMRVDDAAAAAPPAAAPAPPESLADEPSPAPRRAARRGGFGAATLVDQLGGVAAVLYGGGAFLVIVFLFMPLIGDAKLKRKQATVAEGEAALRTAERRYNEKKDKTPADAKAIDDVRETWRKRKIELDEDVEEVRFANDKAHYWDRYFTMFGFVLLAVGAIGFLQPDQPTVRKVVGAVTVTAQMLLVFIYFVVRGAAAGG